MAEFTAEQLAAAKAAKSPEELLAMAKDAGVEMTLEQAGSFLHPSSGEISEEELANVAGGYCHDSQGREVVTLVTPCMHGRRMLNAVQEDTARLCRWPDNEVGTSQCRYLSYESAIWYCNWNVMSH